MPNISAAGTYDKDSIGLGFLKYDNSSIGLSFSGNTLPTTLEVGFINDEATFVPFTNATITALPTSIVVDSVPAEGLVVKVTGGSPDFNLSFAGVSSPLV